MAFRFELNGRYIPGLAAGLFLAALAAGSAGDLSAHELGAMKVEVVFKKAGTFQADLLIDTEHLPLKENPLAGLPPRLRPEDLSHPAVEEKIGLFKKRFLAAIRMAFDGQPASWSEMPLDAEASWNVSPTRAPETLATRIAIRLRGAVPPGAREFTWGHDLQLGDYQLSAHHEGDADPPYEWLKGGETSHSFPLTEATRPLTRLEVIELYLKLGFTHILPEGLDHILFVLGIFLLSLKLKPVLLQVTAFTVAHTITLGLTIYGVVSLSPRIVEPLIALSIAYVAVENLITSQIKPWRVALVFGFGLLHGMGFAGVLQELGLPRQQFIPALISFNVGVEIGQLSVICLAYFTVGLWFGQKSWYRRGIIFPASITIALTGIYWTVERIFC